MSHHRVAILFALGCLVIAGEPQQLVHQGPGGLSYTLTADGLTSIRIGEREVATGGFRLRHDLGSVFSAAATKVAIAPLGERSLVRLADDTAEVVHRHGPVTARYRYRFAGEDVEIQMRIENADPANDLPVVGFQGPRFIFAKEPGGHLFSHNPGYINHPPHGGLTAFCHPSYFNRIGGAWRSDGSFGYGLTPLRTGLARTLFIGDQFSDRLGKDGAIWRQGFLYVVPAAVPADGARSFAMNLRVSANADRWHLLEPYKRHFQDTFGPCRYRADHRPFADYHGGDSNHHVTPENPFGFNGRSRRIDTPDGGKAFCDWIIPGLKAANAQGFLGWAIQGWDARGAMYRTDFHIFPEPIARNLPYIRERFDAAGLRMGLCTRPGEFTIRGTAREDWTLRLNADDPQHLDVLWHQFREAMRLGFSAFYLDTFGNTVEDVKIMRYLRERMGPEIQTYVEHQCDIVMVYSGAYKEVGWDVRNQTYHADEGNWEVYRWLVSGIQSVVVNRVDDSKLPPGAERPMAWLYRHGMTPMLPDFMAGDLAPEVLKLTSTYLDAAGSWKTQPADAGR